MRLMFIYRSGDLWHASKPGDEGWLELFDSDTLPTPYRAETPPEQVVAELRSRNPGYDVLVVQDE